MPSIVGQPKTIKQLNQDLIKQLIKDNGPMTKPDIAKKTNLSLTTVNKAVENLCERRMIISAGKVDSTGGRKATAYVLNGDMGTILGLYYYQGQFICFTSNIMHEMKYKNYITIKSDHQENFLTFIFSCIDHLIQHSSNKNIVAIGIGIPGVVKKGVVFNIPKFKSLESVNLKQLIEDKYKIKVFIENDVNITTLGLYHEKYKKITSHMVFLYMGDGIGSGLIMNKKLYQGFSNFAGEISHLTVGKGGYHTCSATPSGGELEAALFHIHHLFQGHNQHETAMNILIDMMTKTLTNMICIINPAVLAIDCIYLDEQQLSIIKEKLASVIGNENLPRLEIYQMQEATNINGIVNMCLRETNTGYSLLRGKED